MTSVGRSVPGPIAIDGPAAAGKTTVGSLVAEKLGWPALDTGLMYRAVGYLASARGVALDDETALATIVGDTDARADGTRIVVSAGGSDVGDRLADPAVSRNASTVASRSTVRSALVAKQRRLSSDAGGRIVMVGRDIGTVVLPEAPTKIYLNAPATERARRRHLDESRADGSPKASYEAVLAELEARDARDREREDSPLKAAADARVIESGGMSIDEVVTAVVEIAERAGVSEAPGR